MTNQQTGREAFEALVEAWRKASEIKSGRGKFCHQYANTYNLGGRRGA